MTYPAMLSPLQETLEVDPFLEYSAKGLFAAPWLGRPDPLEILATQRLARSLGHAPATAADWTPALSHLMQVRSECLLAAHALDPIPARSHYSEALKACKVALNILHHATDGPERDLAHWTMGVYTLIQAQLAMPDLAETERLAREAAVLLSNIYDPLAGGAEADAHAATRLAQEPAELTRKLEHLPERVLDRLEHYRYELDRTEAKLNQALAGVTEAHTTAFRAVLLWGALNLILMLSLPLNGQWAPSVPWSLPLAVAVPVLWWLTWDRPFRNGMPFFDWVRSLRVTSLAEFHKVAADLPNPGEQFRAGATALLREGRRDREVLAAFHLFTLPSAADTIDDAARLAEEGKELLHGAWMLELKDTSPWRLADALPVQPSLLPNGTRIYYGE